MASDALQRLHEGQTLHAEGRFSEAIQLLRDIVQEMDTPATRRALALALGGCGEDASNWANRLGVTPPPGKVGWMRQFFDEANAVDPLLADPYWDIAVSSARWLADFETAALYLEKARSLGYRHPRWGQVEAIIERGRLSGKTSTPPLQGAELLCTWLWELMVAPELPLEAGSASPFAEKDLPRSARDDWERRVTAALTAGELDGAAIALAAERAARADLKPHAGVVWAALHACAQLSRDPAAIAVAGTFHLQHLLRFVQWARAQADQDPSWLARGRKSADQALAEFERCRPHVDLNLRAELLLARANLFSHPQRPDYAQAFRAFREGVRAKRELERTDDLTRLRRLLEAPIQREIFHLVTAARAGLGKLGGALEIAEAGHELAQALDAPDLVFHTSVALAETYSQIGRSVDAEKMWRQLALQPQITAAQLATAEFQIGSTLAEQGHFNEALLFQEKIIQDPACRPLIPASTLWLNYGNTLKSLGRYSPARAAYRRALALLPPQKKDEHSDDRLQHFALLADVEHALGNRSAANRWLNRAEKSLEGGIKFQSLPRIEFHALAARVYGEQGNRTEFQRHFAIAQEMLAAVLTRGPTLDVWESLLQKFSYLDGLAVRDACASRPSSDRSARIHQALITAEAAKGRMLAWMKRFTAPEGAAAALARDRPEAALLRLRSWSNARPGRRVISLFAAQRGLAFFSLAKGKSWDGRWIDSFDYATFLDAGTTPWSEQRDRALAGDELAWKTAASLTELLLLRIGQWLEQTVPGLASGGTELILIPHRAFRGLPLAHVELSSGKTLADLFPSVSIASSAADLVDPPAGPIAVRPPVKQVIRAVVDPDGSLPFARIEGLLFAPPRGLMAREHATTAAFSETLAKADTVILSAHGEFDEAQPWLSKIRFADDWFPLTRLISEVKAPRTQLLVLGTCEGGRFRHSVSDEPVGFPYLFQHAGVPVVVAPLWKIDDFASLIFLSIFFAQLKSGKKPAHALGATAATVRRLKTTEVRVHFENLLSSLRRSKDPRSLAAREELPERVLKINAWLDTLAPSAIPFHSPLDWAAFQINRNLL